MKMVRELREMTSRQSWWCGAAIIHCDFPTKLEVSCVTSGYRSCPFTIIKQNNNHNTQNTDSISRIQWSSCVYVIMQLIGCIYVCARFNLVSSYLRNIMANDKYAEDTSKKKRIRCVEHTRKKNVKIGYHFCVGLPLQCCYSLQSARITCWHHNHSNMRHQECKFCWRGSDKLHGAHANWVCGTYEGVGTVTMLKWFNSLPK
jgi:hypothetical protein